MATSAYKLTYYSHISGRASFSEYFVTEEKAKKTVNLLANSINCKVQFIKEDFDTIAILDENEDYLYQHNKWSEISNIFPQQIEKIKIQ